MRNVSHSIYWSVRGGGQTTDPTLAAAIKQADRNHDPSTRSLDDRLRTKSRDVEVRQSLARRSISLPSLV